MTVVETATGVAGGYCGHLLALAGARVVKAERPYRPGDARAPAARPEEGAQLELWGLDRFLHARKASVAADLDERPGDRSLVGLLDAADVLVDDGALGDAPAVTARYQALLSEHPGLVVVALSPYGLDGPRAGWAATELTELAAGGWLPHGPAGGQPLMPGTPAGRYSAGTLAALGAVLGLTARRRDGAGQLVEVPLHEAYVHMLTAPTVFFSFAGIDMPRMGDGFPFGIYPCADGHLGVSILTQGHWEGLCRLMGRPELAEDPRYRTGVERAVPARAAEIDALVAGWAAGQMADDAFSAGQALRVPVAIVPSPLEVLRSPHYEARRYWSDDHDPDLGPLRLPGPPFRLASGALAPFRRAPRPGADGEAPTSADRPVTGRPAPGQQPAVSAGPPPLQGVRVLDLTAWQAGPMATMILGDFGAEVLKVEAPQRVDGWRGGAGLNADRMYERNPLWNAVNRSKLGVSLDLKSATGRRLFLRLVEDADVVVENFTPRVMDGLGLSYDVLRAVNPGIVVAALSGFGNSGPWRDYSAFAFPTEEVSGLAYLNGEADGPPVLMGASVTDAFVAAMGAFAVAAALERRRRTGEGDHVDLSQIETLTNFLAGALVAAQVAGRDPQRRGNDRPGLFPHGLFPAQPDGELVAVAVRDERDWRALCGAIDRADLAADARLAGEAGRRAARDRVEGAVAAWTAGRDADEVVARLQAVGVPAAVAARPSRLVADEQLWARGFYRILDRAEVGAHPYPGPVVRLGRTPAGVERPAPLYGEHTAEVLGRLLGLGPSDLTVLEEEGVTSAEPLAQDWR